MPPDNPLATIPGGVFGAPATTDPEVDQTTHQLVGGGGGGFPLLLDDGTTTYEITASGGVLTIAVIDDGSGNTTSLAISGTNVVTNGPWIIQADIGQTLPLLDLKDENGVDVLVVDPVTGCVQTYSAGVRVTRFGSQGGTTTFGQLFGVTGGGHVVLNNITTDATENNRAVQFDGYVESDDGSIWTSPFVIGKVSASGIDGDPNEPGFPADGTNYSKILIEASDSGGIRAVLAPAAMRLQLKRCTGQTLPLLWLTDAAGNNLATITANGTLISNAHALPADGALINSDFALWLDDTPGATKLMVKAKDSGGTVRTATIPLT